MRKAEILGLEWPRVNLSTATITLYRTKSGKPRGIPINADLDTAFLAIEPDAEKRTGLVFKRHDGRAWGQVRTAFQTALDRAGIKGARFHDLRHSFASHFMMRGGNRPQGDPGARRHQDDHALRPPQSAASPGRDGADGGPHHGAARAAVWRRVGT